MMWILIYPIFVFLLDRDNTALAWNLYFVLLIVSVGVLSSFDLLPVSYTTFYIVMMLSAYLLVFTLTYIFRKDIEESKNELTQLNNDLEMRVRDEVGRSKEKDALLFEQSKQAQMGEMIAMIAHQWRQPLSAISSTAIAVETKIKLGTFDLDDPSQREAYESMIVDELEKIAMYTQHLSQTIDDFRNFFRPQKNASLTSTTQLVQRSISLLQGLLNNKGVDVELELCEERELHTHVNELIQVLVNIIKNSVDNFEVTATDAPHLLVTTSEEHGQCSIKICDNGGGIAVDAMERIFEPYFSTKSDKNGTGLGLYMSRIIVEDHCQGTLRAYNSQEGACFVVTVPTDHENVQKES
jgi:signal transduction histidine kinase